MSRYRALRGIGCDPLTAAFISGMNRLVGAPPGETRFMHITIEHEDPKMLNILENLTLARAVIEATAEEKVDLCRWQSPCGTLHCSAGHLAHHPHFQQFIRLRPAEGASVYSAHLEVLLHDGFGDSWSACWYNRHLERFFGPDAFMRLFAQHGAGYFDEQLGHELGDKDLALARLDMQIERVKEGELA